MLLFIYMFILKFKYSYVRLFTMNANGYVYETFGISKRLPIKLQPLLIRAAPLDNSLSVKCFIHVVSRSVFIFSVILSFNLLFRFCLPCVGFGGSFAKLGFCLGLWGFANVPPIVKALVIYTVSSSSINAFLLGYSVLKYEIISFALSLAPSFIILRIYLQAFW